MESNRQWVEVLQTKGPGHFSFVALPEAAGDEWYRGASDIVLQGIAGIERDFPEEIHVEIRGENHGT